MPEKSVEFEDSDPSFIRRNPNELLDWAGRLGLSHRELHEAIEQGLIRPSVHKGRARREGPVSHWPPEPT